MPATIVPHMYEESQKCILRYGSEYYLLAAMGIGILLIYMASLVPQQRTASYSSFCRVISPRGSRFGFAPVCGVISIVFLVVMLQYKYPVFTGKMTIKYPLHRKRELYWRNIQRIRNGCSGKTEKAEWMEAAAVHREDYLQDQFQIP